MHIQTLARTIDTQGSDLSSSTCESVTTVIDAEAVFDVTYIGFTTISPLNRFS